jgi:hypothetical protein
MKRNYPLASIWLCAAMCGILLFSCKKDNKPDTTGLLVYTNNSDGAYNVLSIGFVFTGTQVFGNDSLKMAASLTRATTVDIQARFVADTGMIAAYNTKNGTSYLAAPPGSFKLVDNGQFTIKTGATVSDSVLLVVNNPGLLTNSRGYLIPLTITSTNGQGSLISTNRNTYFIQVSTATATFQLKTGSGATEIADQTLSITPSGPVFGNKAVTFAAYANINLPANVTLNVVAKDSLMAVYNKQNNTSYVSVPSGSYSLLNGGAATIGSGSSTSGNFEVDFDATKFSTDATKIYLLPLAIKGSDYSAGTVMYVRVTPVVVNINPANGAPGGTAISRTGWSVTTTTAYLPASNMLDGDPATAWDSDAGNETVILDMGASQTGIKGILISPNYVYTGDNILDMTVYTSTDGTTWKTQGNWVATDYPPTGSPSSPDVENVQFYSPVTARYLKFTTSGTSYVGIGELNVVK